METVANGVHQIGAGGNAFVVDGDQGVVLIDTGMPGRQDEIESTLRRIGRDPGEVAAILLTHAHVDHTGGAARLRDRTGAPVLAPVVDAPAIRGEAPAPPPPMLSGLLRPLTRFFPDPDPVEVDHEVSESRTGGIPDDFTVIDSPGHTPGHISYLLDRSGRILFVGDAAVGKDGRVAKGFMNRHTPQFDASIRHLAEHDFETAFFGHSAPIESGASAAFASFASTL